MKTTRQRPSSQGRYEKRQRQLPGANAMVMYAPRPNTVRRKDTENHYFDLDRSAAAVPVSTTTWSASAVDPDSVAALTLFAPVTGDDIMNRSGRKAILKTIRINGRFTLPPQTAQAAGDEVPLVRFIVVHDKQTNAAQATGDQVISSGVGANALEMMQSLATLGRFTVLSDKRYTFQPQPLSGLTGAFTNAGQVKSFQLSLKINQPTNFNTVNGGTVADIVDNSYHCYCLANNAAAGITLQYKSRCVFTP